MLFSHSYVVLSPILAVSNASREVSFTFKAIRKDGLLAAILEKMDDGSFKVKVAIGYRAGAVSVPHDSK